MKNAIRQSCRRLLAAAALLLAALLTTPGALAQATVTYFHNDAAGTPWLATNQSGAVLWKENYLPYGYRQKVEPASADNTLWFAGRPYDPDTGMTYMGARYYMPLLGRFTGMDPKEMNPEQIHSFNRYAYANNNPNKYLDPDGKLAETVWDAFNISIGFQSLASNVRDGNWSGAAVDAAGVAMVRVAAAIPVVPPGGVGVSIAAYRSIEQARLQATHRCRYQRRPAGDLGQRREPARRQGVREVRARDSCDCRLASASPQKTSQAARRQGL